VLRFGEGLAVDYLPRLEWQDEGDSETPWTPCSESAFPTSTDPGAKSRRRSRARPTTSCIPAHVERVPGQAGTGLGHPGTNILSAIVFLGTIHPRGRPRKFAQQLPGTPLVVATHEALCLVILGQG